MGNYSKMPKVTLKPLTKEFTETLRQWRNENRRFFTNQKTITKKMQQKWYNKYKKDSNDTIYIVFYEGEPVGALATIKKGKDIEIGRVMLGKKEYAKQGIMGKSLENAMSKYKNRRIFLEVLKNNEVAINFYKKHKFKITGEKNNCYIMQRWV